MRNGKIFASLLSLSLIFNQSWAKELKPKTSTTLPSVLVTATAEKEGRVDGYKTGSSSSSMRVETPLLDTPQSISVVTQEQIRDQNITKMEEAARYVPGVNVQMGEGHRDQVTIRGMTNGTNGTTSNFFIDGARDDSEYIRDFYNTDRVEFLKGPNALAFGRGSPGGLINRISKKADGLQKRRLTLSGGSYEDRRVEMDLGDRVNEKFSLRLNSMYQKSNSYRDYAGLERYGFNPTASVELGEDTNLQVGYEHFDDARTVDRGIPAQNGAPYKTSPSAAFGYPNENKSNSKNNSFYGIITHNFDATLQLKNNARYSNAHKFYRNSVPGAISGNGLAITAYQAKTERESFTNQTDLIKKFETGSVKHTALFGTEITTQHSTKVRNNGIFDSTGTTSSSVSLSNPISYESITYNTIAISNKSDVRVFAGYLQDQAEINDYVQLTAGLRLDRFEVKLKDKANNQNFERVDTVISPRAGLVVKPQKSVSLYASYGVTYLPSSGDQFDSLSVTTNSLQPEKIDNYEVGAKWDVNPRLNLSTALYQLDRSNTPASDPSGSGYSVLTGQSRTRGIEFATTGKITEKWQAIASYAFQEAVVTNATKNYVAGSKVALVPHNTFALWNKYEFTSAWSSGLGIISQSDQFADANNSVRLKGFTRFDGAVYYKISPSRRLQINVENIFDLGYAQTAHSSTNILPGSPRAFKAALIADF
jgi:catecholate siderophore receptor